MGQLLLSRALGPFLEEYVSRYWDNNFLELNEEIDSTLTYVSQKKLTNKLIKNMNMAPMGHDAAMSIKRKIDNEGESDVLD